MKAIDAARKVYAESQVCLIRNRKDSPLEYDVKEAFQGRKQGWFYLDSFTASAIVKVHEAVNAENQVRLERLPIEKMARICFSLLGSK